MIVNRALSWLIALAALVLANPIIHDSTQEVLSADHISAENEMARPSACGPFHSYTALGDSYACGFASQRRMSLCAPGNAGFGSTCTTFGCGQDVGGYAWKFRAQHNVENFQYLACNGNDTQAIIDDQISTPAKLFGDPDVVTINAGGDDRSFFSKVVLACVFEYDSASCDREIAFAAEIIEGLPAQYAKIFAGIKARVRPGTKVVAMSYAQFWGSQSCWVWPYTRPSQTQKLEMNKLARDMNSHLREETLKAGYLYGDVDAAFEGRRFCDGPLHSALFMSVGNAGFDLGWHLYYELAPFHPTVEGQDIMLRVLNGALQC